VGQQATGFTFTQPLMAIRLIALQQLEARFVIFNNSSQFKAHQGYQVPEIVPNCLRAIHSLNLNQ